MPPPPLPPPPSPPPPPYLITLAAAAHSINISLIGDSFVDRDFTPDEVVQLVHGLQSDRLADGSWEARVLRELRQRGGVASLVRRHDATTLTVDIPHEVGYDSLAPEEISISLPGSVLASGQRTLVLPSFTITAERGEAQLSGSLLVHNTEAALRSDQEHTLEITLSGDRWRDNLNVGVEGVAAVRQLLSLLRVAPRYRGGWQLDNPERSGWQTVVQPVLSPSLVTRRDERTLTIRVPQCLNYDVTSPETIQFTVPASAVVSANEIAGGNTVTIRAVRGAASLSGTLLSNATEKTIATEGATLVLTLSGDAWAAEVGVADNLPTRSLFAGLSSSHSEPGGWNAVVRPWLSYLDVSLLDAATLSIRIHATAYRISRPETIGLEIPALALASQESNVTVRPSLVIAPTPGSVALEGSLCQNASGVPAAGALSASGVLKPNVSRAEWLARRACSTHDWMLSTPNLTTAWLGLGWVPAVPADQWEWELQNVTTGENCSDITKDGCSNVTTQNYSAEIPTYNFNNPLVPTLRLVLYDEQWADEVGTSEALARQIFASLRSAQHEPSGWNAVVQPSLLPRDLARLSDTEIEITLPPNLGYEIFEPETVRCYLPAAAVVSNAALVAAPDLEIVPTKRDVTATLSGSLLDLDEAQLRAPGADVHLLVTLVNDTWRLDAGHQAALAAGFSSSLAATPAEAATRNASLGGWLDVASPALVGGAADYYLLDAVTLRIGIPQLPTYHISEPETISLLIPTGVLYLGHGEVAAAPSFTIRASAGTASLGGSLLDEPTEAAVQDGTEAALRFGGFNSTALQLRITLHRDTWLAWGSRTAGADPLVLPEPMQRALLEGLSSTMSEPSGWNEVVRPALLRQMAYTAANCTMLYPGHVRLPEFANITAGDLPVMPRYVLSSSVTGTYPKTVANGTFVNGNRSSWYCPRWWPSCKFVNDTQEELVPLRDCPSPYRLVAVDSRTVALSMPPVPQYGISYPEEVALSVPGSAVASRQTYEAFPRFTLQPSRGALQLVSASSTLQQMSEVQLRANASTLVLRLTGDEWLPTRVGEIFTGLTARQADPLGWNAVVAPTLHAGLASLSDSNRLLTISLPAAPSYDVRTTETILLTVPYGVVRSQQRPAGEVSFAVEAVAGTAMLEGTVLPLAAEQLLNTLGQAAQSFTVTLTGDVWDPAIGLGAGAHTQGFIAGLRSAQNEPAGWNAVVRPALNHAHLSRVSDTQLRVALPARAAYDISQPETVSLTIPSAALLSRQPITASPSFVVTASRGTAVLSGEYLADLTQGGLQGEYVCVEGWTLPNNQGSRSACGYGSGWVPVEPLEIQLYGDTWARVHNPHYLMPRPGPVPLTGTRYPGSSDWVFGNESEWLGLDEAVALELIQGIRSMQSEPTGWNAIVQRSLQAEYVCVEGLSPQGEWGGVNGTICNWEPNVNSIEVLSWDRLLVHLPAGPPTAGPEYAIAAPETIVAVLPPSALRSGQETPVTPYFELRPSGAIATFTAIGLGVGRDERVFRSWPNPELMITLEHDTWHPSVGNETDTAGATQAMLNNIFTTQSEPGGWNAAVVPVFTPSMLTRVSDTVVRILVPTVPTYDIDAPETLRCTVPRASVVGRQTIVAAQQIEIKPESGTGSMSGSIFDNNAETSLQMEPVPPPVFAHNATARLAGSLVSLPTEAALVGTGTTLVVRLLADTFVPPSTLSSFDLEALTSGFTADGDEAKGWNAVVRPTLALEHLTLRANATELVVSLPGFAGANRYSIRTPEVLTVSLPAAALTSGRAAVVASPPLRILAEPSPIDLTGSPMPAGLDEAAIRDTATLSLTLRLDDADGWVAGVDADQALRYALAGGVRSAQDEPNGWNAVVLPALAAASWIVTPGSADLTIQLPRLPAYNILAPETVEVAVHSSLLLSGRGRLASPSRFIVHPEAGVPSLASSLLLEPHRRHYSNATSQVQADLGEQGSGAIISTSPDSPDTTFNASMLREPRMDGGGLYHVLVLQLDGDVFLPQLGAEGELSVLLLRSLTSDQNEPGGWNAVLSPNLTHAHLDRPSESSVRLTIPPTAGYNISAPETIRIVLPGGLVASNRTYTLLPPLVAKPDEAIWTDMEVESNLLPPVGVVSEQDLRTNATHASLSFKITLTHMGSGSKPTNPDWNSHKSEFTREGATGRSYWPSNLEAPGFVAAKVALLASVVTALRNEDGGWEGGGESGGWDEQVMRGGAISYWYTTGVAPLLTVTRLSDYTILVECPLPLPNYDISTPELLRVAVPAAAYCNDAQCPLKDVLKPWTGLNQAAAEMLQQPSGCGACVAEGAVSDLVGPSMLVLALPGAAQAQGTLMPTVSVEQLRTAQEPPVLELTLTDDRWSEALVEEVLRQGLTQGGTQAERVLSSFRSPSSQQDGWNAVMHSGARTARTHVTMAIVSNTTATIAFEWDAFADYAPRTPETVRLTLPGSAVASGVPLSLGSFVVTVDAGSATLSGSLSATPTEAALRSAEPQTLRLTLQGDTWSPMVGLEGDVTSALLSSLSSAQSEAAAWLEVVKPGLSSTDLERLDAHTLVLTVPQRAAYDISAPETISWNVPAEATASGLAYWPWNIAVQPRPGIATLGGTLLLDRQERTMRGGGKTLIIRLSGDTWAASLVAPTEAVADELFDGLSATPQLTGGSLATMRPLLSAAALTLLDNSTLRISLPVAAAYHLHGTTETLRLELSAGLLTSRQPLRVYPDLQIVPTVTFSLVLTLYKDSWHTSVGKDSPASDALLGAVSSLQDDEPMGWNAVMRPRLRYHDLERLDRTTMVLRVPQLVDFEIVEAETIRAMLPGVALSSQTTGVAVPNLVVYPFSGSAFLSGDLTNTSVDEHSMRLVTRELYVHLRHNTFSYALANASDPSRSTICQEILDGIVSRLAGPGWNAQVAGLDAAAQITRTGPQELRLRLPPLPAYSITEPETVDVTLPSSSLVARQPLLAGYFVVLADPGFCDVSGSLMSAGAEDVLQTRQTELVLTLRDDTWLRSIVDDPVVAAELFLGTSGMGGGLVNGIDNGWNTRVRPILTQDMLRLESDTVLVLTVPSSDVAYPLSIGGEYKISTPETITVAIPAAALRTLRAIVAAPAVRVQADRGSLTVEIGKVSKSSDTGQEVFTYDDGYTSEDGQLSVKDELLRVSEAVIYLKLQDDTWDHPDDFNRTNWLDVLATIYTSEHVAPFGWKQAIMTRMREQVWTQVVRESDTELRLKLPMTSTYKIFTPETITISLPETATRARRRYTNVASFVIRPSREGLFVADSYLDEELLRSDASLKIVTFQLDVTKGKFWSEEVASFSNSDARIKLLEDLKPYGNGGGPLGWSNMVEPYLTTTNSWQLETDAFDATKDDIRSSLSLRLFQYENYNITAPELCARTLPLPTRSEPGPAQTHSEAHHRLPPPLHAPLQDYAQRVWPTGAQDDLASQRRLFPRARDAGPGVALRLAERG